MLHSRERLYFEFICTFAFYAGKLDSLCHCRTPGCAWNLPMKPDLKSEACVSISAVPVYHFHECCCQPIATLARHLVLHVWV